MMDLLQCLESYFGTIAPSDQETIVSFFEKKSVARGEHILYTHQQCHHLSFVQSGIFRVYAQVDDKEVIQWMSTPGYFVTDISSYIISTPSRWNIQAITEGELYSLSREHYLQLSTALPMWKELEKRFLVRCFSAMEDRIFTHLSMTTEERYVHFFENNKALFNQVPLQYIASMLGMTPETFSRIRNKRSK